MKKLILTLSMGLLVASVQGAVVLRFVNLTGEPYNAGSGGIFPVGITEIEQQGPYTNFWNEGPSADFGEIGHGLTLQATALPGGENQGVEYVDFPQENNRGIKYMVFGVGALIAGGLFRAFRA